MPLSAFRRPLTAVTAALILGGCAHAPVPANTTDLAMTTPGVGDREAASVARLLAYYRRIAVLPPTELQSEYAAAEQTFLQDPRPEYRLRLALLLALPDASFYNPDSALRLLQGYPGRSDPDDALANFAFFLIGRSSEQHNAQMRLDTASQRATALQRQLDGLKSIERSLNRRQLPRATP